MKSDLCVGGPLAGQRFSSEHEYFKTVDRPTLNSAALFLDDPVVIKTVEEVTYRREFFHTPEGMASFWAPATQTPLESITLLLETYERWGVAHTECGDGK